MLLTLKSIKSIYTSHLTKMEPVLNHLDPANNFAMVGLHMAFTRELLLEGKPLPKTLFLNVMV